MAFLHADEPGSITYDRLTTLLRCVRCETLNRRGMALLKCMHFVCISKHISARSTCLDTFKRSDGGNSYICPSCEIITLPEDIEKRRVYTQEVLMFYRLLNEAWSDCEAAKARCERCFRILSGPIGFESLRPCRTCIPTGLYCIGDRGCLRDHLLESHRLGTVCDSNLCLDWEIMNNAVRMFPQFHPSTSPGQQQRLRQQQLQQRQQQLQQRSNPGATEGRAGALATTAVGSLPGTYAVSSFGIVVPVDEGRRTFHEPGWIPVRPPVQHECAALLEIIIGELDALSLHFDKMFRETLGSLSAWKFPRYETLKTAYTKAIYHNEILHILISGYPDNIQAWTAIQPEFSALSIFKECRDIFPDIGVRRTDFMGIVTKDQTRYYIIPAFTQPPDHVFNKDIKGIITAPAALPSQQSPAVEISFFKLELGPAGYQESEPTTRRCVFEEVHEPDVQNLPESIRGVKLGKRVYAYTTASSVNIAMMDEDGVVLKNWMISQNGQSFGRGLWWDGSRLFALLVNTTTVACWRFEKKNFLVTRNDITLKERNLQFAVNDSLVVQEDSLCVCFHPLRPSQDGMICTTLQTFIRCYNLKSGVSLTGKVALMLSNPPSIKLPLLLGCQQLPHILILDRTQPGNSLVYRAPDESWNKLKLRFDHLQPVHVTDAWLERGTFLRVSYTTTAAPNEAETAVEVDAGAAAAFPPPTRQLIKQIRISLVRT